VIDPSILVTKTPHQQTIPLGGTANWTITITNTSTVDNGLSSADLALTGVNTTDLLASACQKTAVQIAVLRETQPAPANVVSRSPDPAPAPGSTFQPGDSLAYKCSESNVQAAFDNVVEACGTAADNDASSICDDDQTTVDDRTGSVSLESLTSKQNVIPNDAATLAGFTGTPNGNMRFKLYKGDCLAANLVFD
jgi:hypothetical protein